MGVYSGYCRERTYRAYAPPSSRGAAGAASRAGRPVRVSRVPGPRPPRGLDHAHRPGPGGVRPPPPTVALLYARCCTAVAVNAAVEKSVIARVCSVESVIARIRTHVDPVDARRTTSSGALEPLARCVPHTGRPGGCTLSPLPGTGSIGISSGSERTALRGAARDVRRVDDVRSYRACRCQPSMPDRQDRSDLVDDLATRGTITLHGCNNRTDTRPPWAVHDTRCTVTHCATSMLTRGRNRSCSCSLAAPNAST